MLLGVLADTHDNLPMVERATTLFAERRVSLILHAGDFVAPFALRTLLKGGIRIVGVFGNNDGERAGLAKLCGEIHDSPCRLELSGRTVVLAHDPSDLTEHALEGADLAVCGHTHRPGVTEGRPLKLNPGEAGGWLTGRCTVALVDLDRLHAEILDLGSQETVEL